MTAGHVPFVGYCGTDMTQPEHYCRGGSTIYHHRPDSDPFPHGETEHILHELTHAEMTDGTLTPACQCGWYSPNRQHAEFERHIAAAQAALGEG